jgi:hypothetical protein
MSSLFDDLARTLASPMPRRKTLKLLGQSLLGGFFAPLALAACGTSGCPCTGTGQGTCNTNLTCVTCGSGGSACVATGQICCKQGNSNNGGGAAVCSASHGASPCCVGNGCGATCGTGGSCCASGQCCCPGTSSCSTSSNCGQGGVNCFTV